MAIPTDKFKCANCRGEFYLADYNVPDELYALDEEVFEQVCNATHKEYGILCSNCYDTLNEVLPFDEDITVTSGTIH